MLVKNYKWKFVWKKLVMTVWKLKNKDCTKDWNKLNVFHSVKVLKYKIIIKDPKCELWRNNIILLDPKVESFDIKILSKSQKIFWII